MVRKVKNKTIKSDRKTVVGSFQTMLRWQMKQDWTLRFCVDRTRCILTLISFPCNRVRVRVILPESVPETGVS